MASQPIDLDSELAGLQGEIHTDKLHRLLYAQDASIYAMEPLGVAYPRDESDVQLLIQTAERGGFSLVPRAGGTSLAGQAMGDGLVMDTGRFMNQILELNVEEKWVRVQPGVILDDLNRYLAPHGLAFGPDTSTSNRCMIGGMIGNNSCGSHSILYGNTMRHVMEVRAVFSDGVVESLQNWDEASLNQISQRTDALGAGVRALQKLMLTDTDLIQDNYPPRSLVRRNTGYPLDDLVFRQADNEPFSLPRFLCGTEGTLAITVEAKLGLVDKPQQKIVVCAHFHDLIEALEATVIAVGYDPSAVELIDRTILEATKNNREQTRNRFFVEGDPDGVLVIEFYRDSKDEVEAAATAVIKALQEAGKGYAFPIIRAPDDNKVWELRKAGLGLLMGIKGDVKAISFVEDTAVDITVLPAYIADFMKLMEKHGKDSVYHAHASVGELHLRPEINLKDPDDLKKFVEIAQDSADLVRHYRGSLSGEHGDGRVRSPMIRRVLGDEVYDLHSVVKDAFDPSHRLNPGIIVDAHPIDENLRIPLAKADTELENTFFDWSPDLGFMRAVEKCNGAGVCRKPAAAGGTMCPSYMVTSDEKDSTRGRANVFRNLLLEGPSKAMRSHELNDALDLCLSCKACKSECPASVDMGRLKAEFTQHYHEAHGVPLASWFFGNYARLSRLAAILPGFSNFLMTFGPTRALFGFFLKLAPQRSMPAYAKFTFSTWWRKNDRPQDGEIVWLYVDPFTEFTEPEIGIAAVRVLEHFGYAVELLPITDDGRTQLSKGLVKTAKRLSDANVRKVADALAKFPERRIIGLEPSALLTFRDELPDLVSPSLKDTALDLASRADLFDEFLDRALSDGRIDMKLEAKTPLILHGHCHQKALSDVGTTSRVLKAAGYDVQTVPSGCCGMAGSFGYEAKHYELSMQVGELVLFPRIRKTPESTCIAAPGTSCRHQIADGTSRKAEHPAVLVARALGLNP